MLAPANTPPAGGKPAPAPVPTAPAAAGAVVRAELWAKLAKDWVDAAPSEPADMLERGEGVVADFAWYRLESDVSVVAAVISFMSLLIPKSSAESRVRCGVIFRFLVPAAPRPCA